MSDKPTSVLLVEDNPADALLLRDALRTAGDGRFHVQEAARLGQALERLREDAIEFVVCDLNLPDSQGLDTFLALHDRAPELPIVVLTAVDDEQLGVLAIRRGAQDYVVKGELSRRALGRAIGHALERWRLENALREANENLEAKVRERTAELRESEGRFRSLTELSSDYYWEQDEQFRFVAGIETEHGKWRYPAHAVIGKARWELPALNLTDADWAKHRADLEAHREFRNLEIERLLPSGERRWISSSGRPIFDADGRFRGYRGVGSDITERKRTEQLLALEHSVTRCFAETPEAALALKGAIQAICESEQWECGRYLWVDAAAGLLRFGEAWSVPDASIERYFDEWRAIAYAPGEGLAGRVWQSQRPLWVSDVTNDPRVARPGLAQATGMCAALVVPVIAESRTIGVLNFNSRRVREPDEHLLQTIRVIGTQIGQFVQRAHAEQALRESEARYRSLFDNMLNGFAYCGMQYDDQERPVDFVYLDVNNAFERLTGLKNVVGKQVTEVIPGIRESTPELFDIYDRVATTGVPEAFEIYVEPLRHWFSISVYGLEKGHFVAVFDVITARKKAEDALRESEERLRTIFEGALDGIVVANAQTGKILVANPEICRMLGYSPEEIVRLGMPDIHREQDLPHAMEQFERLRRGEIQMAADVPVMRKDGSLFFADIKAAPVWLGGMDCMLGVFRDITERKRADAQLRLQAAALESAASAILITDREGTILWVNRAFSVHTGYSAEEAIGQKPSILKSGAQGPEFYRRMYETILGGEVWQGEIVNRYKDGRLGSEQMTITPVRASGGEITHFIAIKEDITERLAQQRRIERLNRIRALMGAVNSLIVRTHDRDELHREACRIAVEHGGFGMAWIGRYDAPSATVKVKAWSGFEGDWLSEQRIPVSDDRPQGQGIVGRAVRECKVSVDNDIVAAPSIGVVRPEAVKRGLRSVAALPLLVKDRVTHVMVLYAREPGFFDADEVKLLNEMAADLSFSLETIKKEARLAYLSHYDLLTGLANRTLFGERLAQHLRARAGGEATVATVLFDIERLQMVNDSFGRHAGDELLKQFAQRLEQALGREELVARVVSDCFAAIVRGVKVAAELAHLLEQTILPALAQPFMVGGTELRVGVKVGIALFPSDGQDPETVYRNAEAALRKTKASGERYLFYSPEMNARVAETLSLETKLRRALKREEFVLHYQPKLEVRSGRILGVEALMRWNDPDSGLVAPARFIPVLEETGMIREAGQWALRQVIADLGRWRAQGLATRAAVNVSAVQLRQRDFVRLVHGVLDGAPNDAGLDLEITESLLMENVEESIGKLRALRERGVNIAIDDFGTGYSSLSYLGRLPVNALKIDRSFIVASTMGPDGLALVSTIISLAHAFNFAVVAEGVDSEEQLNLLRLLRCDEWQGFLYSKPVPAAQVPELLRAPPFGT